MTEQEIIVNSIEIVPRPSKGISLEEIAQREAEEGVGREIINGEWAEENEMAGQRHGLISGEIFAILRAFVKANNLGQVYPDSTAYMLAKLENDVTIMRIPDVSFVAEARVNRSVVGMIEGPPDLAVEVISPSERPAHTLAKMLDYLTYGSQQVWIIDPEMHQITVYTPDDRARVYNTDETLGGGDLLPGFELFVGEIFANLD